MSYVQVAIDSSGHPVNLFYQDWGQGQPVVFIHGWPLSHEMWEYQLTELPRHGLRCIAYDRRGFGKSSKPWEGYTYDTFADDLKAVLDELNLEDVMLVGFSMGGGEVARYFSRHGGARVSKVVLLGSVTPYLLKTDIHPDGISKDIFDDMIEAIQQDRPAFLSQLGKQFYGVSTLSHPVSQAFLDWVQMLALQASPKATMDCVRAFSETDFHSDLPHITVPTMVIHGDSDKTVPVESSGVLTAQLIPDSHYKVYSGAPHGLFYIEREQLNQDLRAFISADVRVSQTLY